MQAPRFAGSGSARAAHLKRFAQSTSGAAVTEYVLLVAIIVGAGFLVYYSLSVATGDSFHELAGFSPDGHASGSRRLAAQPLLAEADDSASQGRIAPEDTTSPSLKAIQLAGWYAALATAIGVWYLLRRQHRRSAGSRAPADEDPFETMSPSQRRRLFEKRQQILNILSRDVTMLLGNSVEVHHLMSRDPMTVRPTTPTEDVAKMMDDARIRHLLVCNNKGQLAGIISDRDFQYRSGATAGALMTPEPLVVQPNTPIGPAITIMLDQHISCLPVTEDGIPAGVLTSTDLVMSLQCTLQALMKTTTVPA